MKTITSILPGEMLFFFISYSMRYAENILENNWCEQRLGPCKKVSTLPTINAVCLVIVHLPDEI